jgi:tripartite-type tricarboxylate transporter receptor subunit TctC
MFKKIIATVFVSITMIAHAQTWQPSKPIEAVIGFTPGSANEILFRALSKDVEANTKAKFVVVNKAGGGGVLGTEYLGKQPADGYTVAMITVAGIAAMDKIAVPDAANRSYTTDTFVYPLVAALAPYVIVAHPRDDVSTPQQFVDVLKKDKVAFSASGGARLVYEMLLSRVKFVEGNNGVIRVEHKGPVNTLTDIAGGHVRFGVVPASVAFPFYRDNRVKIIAVSTARSIPQIPDAKPLSTVLPGFDVPASWGLALHKNTPPEVVQWYVTEFAKSARSEETRKIYETNLFQFEPGLTNIKSSGDYIKAQEKLYQPLIDNVLKQINKK